MHGSSGLDGYVGWIPLTSANVVLEFAQAKSEVDLSAIDAKKNPEGYRLALKAASKEPENCINCGKYVDSSTPYLMELSIRDKLMGNASSASNLLAEIHFVETAGQDTIQPFLQIAMERVHVEDWNVGGDADERPQESFKLVFERFAIKYTPLPTVDMKGRQSGQAVSHIKGFDQNGPETWNGPWPR